MISLPVLDGIGNGLRALVEGVVGGALHNVKTGVYQRVSHFHGRAEGGVGGNVVVVGHENTLLIYRRQIGLGDPVLHMGIQMIIIPGAVRLDTRLINFLMDQVIAHRQQMNGVGFFFLPLFFFLCRLLLLQKGFLLCRRLLRRPFCPAVQERRNSRGDGHNAGRRHGTCGQKDFLAPYLSLSEKFLPPSSGFPLSGGFLSHILSSYPANRAGAFLYGETVYPVSESSYPALL